MLCRPIVAAKRQFFVDKFDRCLGDIKMTWRSIKSILKPNSQSKFHPTIHVGGRVVASPSEAAEKFNLYFSNIEKELDTLIPINNTDPLSILTQ